MRRLLVVDYRHSVCQEIAAFLRGLGYTVETRIDNFDSEFWDWLEALPKREQEILGIVGCYLEWSETSHQQVQNIRELAQCLSPPLLVAFVKIERRRGHFGVDLPHFISTAFSQAELKQICGEMMPKTFPL